MTGAIWSRLLLCPKVMENQENIVSSFFYYMWNAWCEEECKKAFEGGDWKHFWKKWCGICDAHGVWGAAERFFAELSERNKDLLVKRACQVYNRGERIDNV